MLHRILYVFVALCCALQGSAHERTANEALHIAQQWFAQQHGQTLKQKSVAQKPLALKQYQQAWCVQQNEQFLLVSINKSLPQVLGYGTKNADELPPTLERMLQRPLAAQKYPLDDVKWTAVKPLLEMQHGFVSPYNDLCPFYTDDEGRVSDVRCVPGCVAIAMEQILTYYRRTYTLQDTLKGWSTPHYEIDDLLPGEVYETQNICNLYNVKDESAEERQAVARLMYALGVASHMNWGLNESGTSTRRLVEPLQRAFGLKYVHYMDSYQYDPVAYWNFIAHELQCKRPVYYAAGAMTTEGHAFVLDGLDEQGLFHVNWGFAGMWDGYFRLDVLAIREPASDRWDKVDNGYFCNQEALVVCPDSVDCLPPDTLHRTGREVVVERVEVLDEPTTQCPTRVRLMVRNVSSQTLTTPLAFIQNTATDTARWEQADWLAFTGCTLQPGERDTLLVHLQFARRGESFLGITPDGLLLTDSLRVNVTEKGTDLLVSDAPKLNFVNKYTVDISQRLCNSNQEQRAAQQVYTDLDDGAYKLQWRKSHRVYLAPQADTVITQRFTDLVPGKSYVYKLRCKDAAQRLTFEIPLSPEGISQLTFSDENSPFYSIDGRKLGATLPSNWQGVVIDRNGKKRVK